MTDMTGFIQDLSEGLTGTEDERLTRNHLDMVKTFGALADWPVERIVRLLRRCVTAGWVSFAGDERPVVVLTDEGLRTMRAERPARLRLPPPQSAGAKTRSRRTTREIDPGPELDLIQQALFESLRAHRLTVAKEGGVPPYVVATDRSLRDLCLLKPRDHAELLSVHGIGPSKADKYGDGFLRVIAESPA